MRPLHRMLAAGWLVAGTTAGFASVAVVHEADVAKPGPPPHEGLGASVGYPLSATGKMERLFFAKRRLLPGATIGRHAITHEEVYYVVSGHGEAISEEGTRALAPGDALTMKTGGTVEVRQTGADNLDLIVAGANP